MKVLTTHQPTRQATSQPLCKPAKPLGKPAHNIFDYIERAITRVDSYARELFDTPSLPVKQQQPLALDRLKDGKKMSIIRYLEQFNAASPFVSGDAV